MSNAHEGTAIVTGEVIEVGPRSSVGKNGTHKTNIVVECSSNDEYKNPVPVEAYGDEISSEASNLGRGDSVRVKCWLKGREYNGRYFCNLSVQKGGIEMLNRVSAQPLADELPIDQDDVPTGELDDSGVPF